MCPVSGVLYKLLINKDPTTLVSWQQLVSGDWLRPEATYAPGPGYQQAATPLMGAVLLISSLPNTLKKSQLDSYLLNHLLANVFYNKMML